MIFQDTAGGTSNTDAGADALLDGAAEPADDDGGGDQHAHGEHDAVGDNKQLIYLKTNGDLYSWDATTKSGAGTKIASSVVKFTSSAATRPVRWRYIARRPLGPRASLDGTKLLDTAASSATSCPRAARARARQPRRLLLPERRPAPRREQRGTLMHVAVTSGATPSKIARPASMLDLHVFDSSLLFLQNVAATGGQFGDAASRSATAPASPRSAPRRRSAGCRRSIRDRTPGSRCT